MSKITLKAMPFDSKEILDPKTGVEVYDRVAYSKDLADWLRTYFSNGILVQGGDVLGSQMQVIHNVGMVCTIKAGGVCINGRSGWLEKDTEVTLKVGGALPRYDRIVAELNIPDDRGIYIKVLEGLPASEPEYPALTQTEDVYQIPLARIKIEADSAKIAEVIDERNDYISNVTIGIKPPTGMDAETVKVSDKTKRLYGVENVDEALKNALAHLSYMAFCINANPDSLDAAFGKNNEEAIKNIGKQMVMYARFKENDSTLTFPNLETKSTINEVALENPEVISEIKSNSHMLKLINSSPYAVNKFAPLIPMNGDYPYATLFSNQSVIIPSDGNYRIIFDACVYTGDDGTQGTIYKNGIKIFDWKSHSENKSFDVFLEKGSVLTSSHTQAFVLTALKPKVVGDILAGDTYFNIFKFNSNLIVERSYYNIPILQDGVYNLECCGINRSSKYSTTLAIYLNGNEIGKYSLSYNDCFVYKKKVFENISLKTTDQLQLYNDSGQKIYMSYFAFKTNAIPAYIYSL
ncbi:hypothetical protein [Anaerovorax sp. IOR16]|uniref:hypothetical protein n=1 Tax=Anaerovorax sp. IOR16 TaxID=2773458 RepID=UPI0019D250B9|nr:hypothetical protein [Anaerovorax sp. IOR16]